MFDLKERQTQNLKAIEQNAQWVFNSFIQSIQALQNKNPPVQSYPRDVAAKANIEAQLNKHALAMSQKIKAQLRALTTDLQVIIRG